MVTSKKAMLSNIGERVVSPETSIAPPEARVKATSVVSWQDVRGVGSVGSAGSSVEEPQPTMSDDST